MAAIELYEFLLDGTYYRYTSGSETVTKDAESFTAEPIRRSGLAHSDDLNRAEVSITTMRDNPFVVAALPSPHPATVTIYGEQVLTTWQTLWKGRITSLQLQGAEAEISTESVMTFLSRPALYAKYQVLCRHVLFDEGCALSAATYKYAGTVSAIDGTTITIPGLNGEANGYYDGGYVKFGSYDYRTIISHTGNDIVIYSVVPGLATSTSADVYPGCDHTETECNTKFSNILNYGGFPWIPSGRSPFDTPKPRKRRR